jgi:hypothetical protein
VKLLRRGSVLSPVGVSLLAIQCEALAMDSNSKPIEGRSGLIASKLAPTGVLNFLLERGLPAKAIAQFV